MTEAGQIRAPLLNRMRLTVDARAKSRPFLKNGKIRRKWTVRASLGIFQPVFQTLHTASNQSGHSPLRLTQKVGDLCQRPFVDEFQAYCFLLFPRKFRDRIANSFTKLLLHYETTRRLSCRDTVSYTHLTLPTTPYV